MRTIYKYTIVSERGDVVEELLMPTGSKPLSVGWQDGVGVVLWALVDKYTVSESRYEFDYVPTGIEVDTNLPFLGTVQTPDGMVGHLFCEGAR